MGADMTEFRADLNKLDPMIFSSLKEFSANGASVMAKGPIGLILLEDNIEVDSTIRHHLDAGFNALIVFGVPEIEVAEDTTGRVHRVHHNMMSDNALTDVVNAAIVLGAGQWMFYAYNTEYLFFPFCEQRTVGEMATFCMEERRSSILTYVVDLYAGDLDAHPHAVALNDAYLDKSGYYALARKAKDDHYEERQLDFFGGLRWRFEEAHPDATPPH